MIRKVLIGWDGSEHCARASQHGAALARLYSAEVELYASYFPGALALELARLVRSASALRALEEQTRAQLAQEAERLQRSGLRVRTSASAEDPAKGLVQRARSGGADLIAIGMRGLSAVAQMWMGSVAERVARQAPCPVLTAHAEHAPPDGYRQIAVATDFSRAALAALAWGRALAEQAGGEIELVHCIPPPATADLDPLRSDDWMREHVKRAREQLAALSKPGESHEILRGHLHAEGAAHFSKRGVELLVLGARGPQGLDYLLLGSHAERAMRHSPVPVVTVSDPAQNP